MSCLELRAVEKRYLFHGESVPACRDVSLTVGDGEFVSLIGPSGCGKSTLLEVIAGLTLPDSGAILHHGVDIGGATGHASYMPQDDLLLPWRTVLSNVTLPRQIAGVPRAEREREARKLLGVFGLERYDRSFPHQLSGGMRQRAAFLRTALHGRDLWLLDEPFARLDAITRLGMQDWLLEIWSRFHYSVLLVTHDIEEALILSDRVYVMSSAPGGIVAEVPVELERPRTRTTRAGAAFTALKTRLTDLLDPGRAS